MTGPGLPFALNFVWTSAGVDIGALVFREGLECVLVLAARPKSPGPVPHDPPFDGATS